MNRFFYSSLTCCYQILMFATWSWHDAKAKMHLWNYSGRAEPLLCITNRLCLICTSNFHFSLRDLRFPQPHVGIRNFYIACFDIWVCSNCLPMQSHLPCQRFCSCLKMYLLSWIWCDFSSPRDIMETENRTIPGALVVFYLQLYCVHDVCIVEETVWYFNVKYVKKKKNRGRKVFLKKETGHFNFISCSSQWRAFAWLSCWSCHGHQENTANSICWGKLQDAVKN